MTSIRLPGMLGASVLLSMVALGALPAACVAANAAERYPSALGSPVSRQLRLTLTIANPTDKTLVDQTVWLYGPVKRTATQELQKLDINFPYQLDEDALGNQIIVIKIDRLAPFAIKLVSIRADLLMGAQPGASELQQPGLFLANEAHIEKDDPAIRAAAAALKADDPATTAAHIYDWVKSTMHYAGFIAEDLGARYAVMNRTGDCTEYAFLATALGRASDVPARTMGGFVMDRNGSPGADAYHNWAELYWNGSWHLLDAQKENFRSKAEWYVATEIVSSQVKNAMQGYHRFRVQGAVAVRLN